MELTQYTRTDQWVPAQQTPRVQKSITRAFLSQRGIWMALAVLLCLRVFSLSLYPLGDTTEARYGEIARLMLDTGDWVVPQHKPNVPYLAKPPLAFWAQAASMYVFGINEFGARISSVLFAACIIALIVALGKQTRGQVNGSNAGLAALMLTTCPLFFVLSGAVVTDMALAACTTLCMVAFWNAHPRHYGWGLLFFAGLGFGMLAKGPIAVVLVMAAITLYVMWGPQRRQRIQDAARRLPWRLGTLVFLALTLPWYIAIELRHPNFFEYFFWGEHIQRFLQPGWAGDLYGSAHKAPKGSIWLYLVFATCTWWPLLCFVLIRHARRCLKTEPSQAASLHAVFKPLYAASDINRYLLCWTLATPLFFSLSSNTIWSYVLPSLPPMALLLAHLFDKTQSAHRRGIVSSVCAAFIAAVIVYVGVLPQTKVSDKKSTKHLLQDAQKLFNQHPHMIMGVMCKQPYSMFFYKPTALTQMTNHVALDKFDDGYGGVFIVTQKNLELFSAGPSGPKLKANTKNVGQYGKYFLLYRAPASKGASQ